MNEAINKIICVMLGFASAVLAYNVYFDYASKHGGVIHVERR